MKYFKQIKLASSLLLGAAIVAMPLATTSCNQDSSIKVPIHTFFENDSGATFHISVHNMFDEPFLALESLQGGKEECVEQILSLIPGVLFFPDLQKFHNDPLAMLETSMWAEPQDYDVKTDKIAYVKFTFEDLSSKIPEEKRELTKIAHDFFAKYVIDNSFFMVSCEVS